MNNAPKYLMTRWPVLIYFTPFNLYFSLFCLNDDFRVIAAEAKQHDCEEKVFVQKLSRKCFDLFPFRGLPPSLPPSVEERGRQFRHENKQRPSPGAAIKRRGENRRATHWLTADGREREREREGGREANGPKSADDAARRRTLPPSGIKP